MPVGKSGRVRTSALNGNSACIGTVCLRGGGGGGGLLPYIDYTICAAGKGMVFKPFTLG